MNAKSIRSNEFVRNVARLFSGKLLAIVIALVATPILSRLFEPTDYGIASFFIAMAVVLAGIYPLAYDRAVVFPKGERTGLRLLLVAIYISVAMSLLSYVVMVSIVAIWPNVQDRSGMNELYWLLPASAFLVAAKDTFVTVCLRTDKYSVMAVAEAMETAIAAASRILWGLLLASSAIGLVIGQVLGVLAALLICLVGSIPWLKANYRRMGWREFRETLLEFSDYPRFRAPARLAFTASRRLPVIALGLIFPAEIVGFYAMANRAAGLPLQAASQSISNVLLRQMLKKRDVERPLLPGVMRVFSVLVLSGIPVFLVLFFLGSELLTWFLGAKWQEAGRYLEILSPYLLLIWTASFASTVFETLRLNRSLLRMHFGNLFARAAVFVTSVIAGMNAVDTLWLFVLVCSIYQIVIMYIAINRARQHDSSLLAGQMSQADDGEQS